jgi:cell division protein FtsN
MAQKRTKTSRKRGASRSSGSSPFTWFVAGLVTGLAIAGFALFNGMVPRIQETTASREASVEPAAEPALIAAPEEAETGRRSREFDFFTVLPEMEVVVPEQELADGDRQDARAAADQAPGNYILQAGSFRSMEDADQLKARLALLGTQANIEVVTVNEVKWHRVRIGPIEGARKADEMRRLLRDNGIDTLILKGSS